MKLLFALMMLSGCTPIERELTEEAIEEIVEYETGGHHGEESKDS